ncbi:MAG: hypothetical protein SFU86_08065 [Pirellulaceae bacterium]|nr:hypothetical protein [Pirellulaceae bacterium]
MAVKLRTKWPDPILRQMATILEGYARSHPTASIEAYRQNDVSIRIRIISPEFQRQSRVDREDEVWSILDKLPAETTAEISLLLLLTPAEAANSFASEEFDDPIPSKL